MAITYTNYDIVQGDTWSTIITYTDPNGSLIDFTGYTFLVEVRDKEGSPSVLRASATLGNGVTVTGLGKVSIELTPTKTGVFSIPRSKYQVVAIDSSLRRTTLLQGWFQVIPNGSY